MKFRSGCFLFFNLGVNTECYNCHCNLKKEKINHIDDVNKAPVVISIRGKHYCVKCALRFNIIDGARYS